ncbi:MULTISPECIES: FixH family protein [Myroides]|uniref:Cytochrome C oxidase Cbb3 n=1 Tax=Myroides albus TaxID=2562892 RepID=A0A6I3LLK1_9FLAO|nr:MULTISPECIES: FixH family protein [Myroides]MTG98150.1 cytochrome C oxidase Cbb3 [Myroides albus]MVX35420.1 cytochrome C oxidase Cbb3 [Myroides sp. LoEW2-1]UVD78636.1 FixH family protein [Myroides albus]
MKFNFGTGIVIAMGIFMIFILQYVIRVQLDSKYDNQLVTENYYQQEIEVDGKAERELNAKKLKTPLKLSITDDKEILVVFPKEFDYSNIKGKISLYRPSDQTLDFDIPISLSSSNLLIPNTKLGSGGRWDISIEWEYKGTSYRNLGSLNLNDKVVK